jgi:hypothetical protein
LSRIKARGRGRNADELSELRLHRSVTPPS